MNLPTGTLLQGGKYKILRIAGAGGFGCTYAAEHVMLRKRVAIKEFFVKDFCNRDKDTACVTLGTFSKAALVAKLRSKFIDEARALSCLDHPGVTHVTDVFEENGTAYFVMDYIDGLSLAEVVRRDGPLSEERAVDCVRQVCAALAYIHAHGRLHLDIKPGNIMLDAQGRAVLIDFGASKQYDEADGENTSTLMGKTPGYAPLEQMGDDVTKFLPATDIYALGATFYKILTGVTPPSAVALASGEPLPPLPPAISPATRAAVAAAMRIRKKDRPQTVADLQALLNADTSREDETELPEIAEKPEPPAGVVAPRKKWAKKKRMVMVFLLAMATSAGLLYFASRGGSNSTMPNALDSIDVLSVDTFAVDTAAYSTYVNNYTYTNNRGITFVYSGEIDADSVPKMGGKGVYDTGTYMGYYKEGMRDEGTFVTRDGANTFKGKFRNDEYYKGRLTTADGSYFIGTFRDNTFDTGTWYNADGSVDSRMVNGKYQ